MKQKNEIGENKYYYNVFSPLQDEIECSLYNKFGHKESEWKIKVGLSYWHEHKTITPKVQKMKNTNSENCGLYLYAGD